MIRFTAFCGRVQTFNKPVMPTATSCGEHCVAIIILELVRLCDRMPWRGRGLERRISRGQRLQCSQVRHRATSPHTPPQINRLPFVSFSLVQTHLSKNCSRIAPANILPFNLYQFKTHRPGIWHHRSTMASSSAPVQSAASGMWFIRTCTTTQSKEYLV